MKYEYRQHKRLQHKIIKSLPPFKIVNITYSIKWFIHVMLYLAQRCPTLASFSFFVFHVLNCKYQVSTLLE